MRMPSLPWKALPYPLVALDLDTTGFLPRRDRVTEIAVIRLAPDEPPRWLESAVSPDGGRLSGAPGFVNLIPALRPLLEGAVVVSHNAALDACFLSAELERIGGRWGGPHLCTLELAHQLCPDRLSYSLTALSRELGSGLEPGLLGDGNTLQRAWEHAALLAGLLRLSEQDHKLTDIVRSLVRLPHYPTAWPPVVGSLMRPQPRPHDAARAARQANEG